jgi:hypothetical protein
LNWSSSNSDAASLDPGGSVDASGTKSITLSPTQSSTGPVDEEFKYTLKATNACGGSDTKTVAVHMKGSIEPIPTVLLHSVFFPTDYPTKNYPEVGLVRSQQEALTVLATGFKQYLEYDPEVKLSLVGYTDGRGADGYNQSLSELRAKRVKNFLVSQGIAPEKIDSAAYGKQKQLDKAMVSDLQTRNPNPLPQTLGARFPCDLAGLQSACRSRSDPLERGVGAVLSESGGGFRNSLAKTQASPKRG